MKKVSLLGICCLLYLPNYSADQAAFSDSPVDTYRTLIDEYSRLPKKPKDIIRSLVFDLGSLDGARAWQMMQIDKRRAQVICAYRKCRMHTYYEHCIDAQKVTVFQKDQTVLAIDPRTIIFDFSGNYAAGYETQLSTPAKRYIFSTTQPYIVVKEEEYTTISKIGSQKPRTIYEATTDKKRTFCFLMSRITKDHYTSTVNGDITYTVQSWKSIANRAFTNTLKSYNMHSLDNQIQFKSDGNVTVVGDSWEHCTYVMFDDGTFTVKEDEEKQVWTWRGVKDQFSKVHAHDSNSQEECSIQ